MVVGTGYILGQEMRWAVGEKTGWVELGRLELDRETYDPEIIRAFAITGEAIRELRGVSCALNDVGVEVHRQALAAVQNLDGRVRRRERAVSGPSWTRPNLLRWKLHARGCAEVRRAPKRGKSEAIRATESWPS